jgi:protein involved in ribonucleotide reduction
MTNCNKMVAVASSGNKNWGSSFGGSGDIVSEMYGVPLIMKIENSGFPKDIDTFIERLERVHEFGKVD